MKTIVRVVMAFLFFQAISCDENTDLKKFSFIKKNTTASKPSMANALEEFEFNPVGRLVENSGVGLIDNTNYNPNMRFPVMNAPAYCNSQVYGFGGSQGPSSRFGWKDPRNYTYPWFDNFCEKRTKYSCCPGKKGHQGQDIRPAGPEDKKYEAVAVDNGRIIRIGNYSVRLISEDGRIEYRYLHLDKETLYVRLGQKVKAGEPLGLISNEFNGIPTTVHLHFEMRVSLKSAGSRPQFAVVSPYNALISSYKKLLQNGS